MELFWKQFALKCLEQVADILEHCDDTSLHMKSLSIELRDLIHRLEDTQVTGD